MNCACGYYPVANCLWCHTPLCSNCSAWSQPNTHVPTGREIPPGFEPDAGWAAARHRAFRKAALEPTGVVCWPCRRGAGLQASEQARSGRTIDEMPTADLLDQLLFVTDGTNRDEIDYLPTFEQVLARHRATADRICRLGSKKLVERSIPPVRRKAVLGWRKTLGVRITGWPIIFRVEETHGDYGSRDPSHAILSQEGRLLTLSGWERHPNDPDHEPFYIAASLVYRLRKNSSDTRIDYGTRPKILPDRDLR